MATKNGHTIHPVVGNVDQVSDCVLFPCLAWMARWKSFPVATPTTGDRAKKRMISEALIGMTRCHVFDTLPMERRR